MRGADGGQGLDVPAYLRDPCPWGGSEVHPESESQGTIAVTRSIATRLPRVILFLASEYH